MSAPATLLASSDARNRAALAISSGLPKRPSGTCAETYAPKSSSVARAIPFLENGRFDGAGADDVHPNFAVLQLRGPGPGERTHRRLRRRINAEGGHALIVGDGRIEDDKLRRRLSAVTFFWTVNNKPLDVDTELFVEMRLGDGLERRDFASPAVANRTSIRPKSV